MRLRNILLIISFIIIFSCKDKDVTEEKDQIKYILLNKSIINEGSINFGIFDLFKIELKKDSATGEKIINLFIPNTGYICNCREELLLSKDSLNVEAFLPDMLINKSDKSWGGEFSKKYHLDNFKGKGELYIGTREHSFPMGKSLYNYKWYRVYLSSNCDTFYLFDSAVNNTEGKSIRTGQKK